MPSSQLTSPSGASVHSNPQMSAASSPPGSVSVSGSTVQRKEVDYYLNPTELFRWINYRRWDGARARVLSHPDECATWIVSRHSSDGRILWRHLPLHLVCMQSESSSADSPGATGSSQSIRQIEDLVDILLEAYPDAANSPDDQGLLPIHLIVANSPQPNERILNLLLMAYPTGVDVKDKYGRTPVDIVKEKAEIGPHREAALRSMERARKTTERMVEALREENSAALESMKQGASNERMASQRIIMRLEEELENTGKQLEDLEDKTRDGEGSANKLANQIEHLKEENDRCHNMVLTVKGERDDLINQNEILRNQVEEHDHIVQALHQDFEGDRQDRADVLAKLKSEVSTSKAMSEALESQLRSRFTNEEYLTTTVSELETQLADLKTQSQQEISKLMHERDAYENENTQLKRTADELTKKSTSLQSKLTEVNKQMSAVLSSHGALNAEHDRMSDANLRAEADLIENMRTERTQMLAQIRKQWEFFESSVKDQEQALEDFQQKEMQLLDLAKDERDRSLEVIGGMRQDFLDARATAMDRQRLLQTDNLIPSTHDPKGSSASTTSNKLQGSPQSLKNDAGSRNSGQSTTNSPQARRKTDRSIGSELSNTRSNKNAASTQSSSSTYTGRSSRDKLPPSRSTLETRLPISSDMSSGERRQGPAIGEQMEGNLLHLLETRADQSSDGRRMGYSGTESTSYGASTASSGLTSSFRHTVTAGAGGGAAAPRQKPRMINFSDASTTHSSSTRGNMSRTTLSSAPKPPMNTRRTTTLSLDEYSHASSGTSASGSMDDSESDASSREGRSAPSRAQSKGTANQYSGMTAGMRMGMIRISEEASQSDTEGRYSRQ